MVDKIDWNLSFQSLSYYRIMNIVKLNVGGKLYTTTRTTLENCGENMLSNLISDKYSPTMIEDAYFIDRNGELFGDILDFLRNIQEYKVPTNSDKVNALLIEAKYYAIIPLIKRLEKKIKHQRSSFWVSVPNYRECIMYACSDNVTPQIIRDAIDRKKLKGVVMNQSWIIETAEKHGYRLINIATSSVSSAPYTQLTFQGY